MTLFIHQFTHCDQYRGMFATTHEGKQVYCSTTGDYDTDKANCTRYASEEGYGDVKEITEEECRKAREKSLVYLAVPYSHPDTSIRDWRFHTVNVVAARMMLAGVHIFSPISHTHPIAMAGALPTGWDFWSAYDHAMLRCCKKLVVLTLDGWQESVGVQAEIGIAISLGIPVEYTDGHEP